MGGYDVGLVLHTSRFAIMDLAQITGFVTGKILLNPSQTGPIIILMCYYRSPMGVCYKGFGSS
jgi:hypothetical protein